MFMYIVDAESSNELFHIDLAICGLNNGIIHAADTFFQTH